MQSEHRFTSTPYDVDMCRPVIVWIDNDAQAPKTQDGWHTSLYHNPSAWVKQATHRVAKIEALIL